jgi:arylsulfatase A-like enzyme
MFRKLIDMMYHKWEGRFKNGVGLSLGDFGFTRFDNGEVLSTIHIGTLVSLASGHWPWYVFEAGYCTGARSAWHIGVLGLTVGKVVVNDYDKETGEIVGPDKSKHYWFFKGLNHQHKQLEEIY